MGNVLEIENINQHLDDEKWLSLTHHSIFDDNFVESVSNDLSDFDTPLNSHNKETQGCDDDDTLPFAPERIRRLAALFSQYHTPTSVNNCQGLSMTKTTILEENSFFVTHRYRRQLLLRIHLAQLRQSSSLKKGCDIISESMCNVTKSGACRNGERNMDMMTETSITMCLAILETLGPTQPDIFKNISSKLISLFETPFAHPMEYSQRRCLKAVCSFAECVFFDQQCHRSEALDLLFSAAVTSRSLPDVIKCASYLLDGTDKLSYKADYAIKLLEKMSEAAPVKLIDTTLDTIDCTFDVRTDITIAKSDVQKYESAVSTDGVFVYVWHGGDCSLRKFGTGFHQSIAGNEYEKNDNIFDEIMEFLGDSMYAHESPGGFVQGWVACVGESVFLRLVDHVLGPFRIAVFSSSTLRLCEVRDICIPLQSFNDAKRLWMKGKGIAVDDDNNEVKEWEHDAELRNILLESNAINHEEVVDPALPLLEWEPTISSSDLSFSNGNSTAQRIGNKGCYPCSNINITGKLVIMTCRLGATPNSCNRMSVGIASADHRGSAFGDTSKSWGISHEAGCNGKLKAKGESQGVAIRKLQDGDQYHLRYDPADGTMILMLDEANGDFTSPDVFHTFNIHEPGEQPDLVMGASFASDYELTLIDFPTPLKETAASLNESTTSAATIFTSTGSMLDGIVTAKLICEKESHQAAFSFDDNDTCRELTFHLRNACKVEQVGCIYSSDDESASSCVIMSVFLSEDGLEYFLMGDTGDYEHNEFNEMSTVSMVDTKGITKSALTDNVKYVRLSFSGFATISYVEILGYIVKPKLIVPPLLPMASDGKHLLFLNARCDAGSGALTAFVVDPIMEPMSPICQLQFNSSLFPEILTSRVGGDYLEGCSFCFNGSQFVSSFRENLLRRADKDKSLQFSFVKFDCASGHVLSVYSSMFQRETGFPNAMCFDARNNMVWGWSANVRKLIRWTCEGVPPRHVTTSLSDFSTGVQSVDPCHRTSALHFYMNLPQTNNKCVVQAAYILGLLDKLSHFYGPPNLPRAENETSNELQVKSWWNKNGETVCEFVIRGQKTKCSCDEGFNILCLDEDFKATKVSNFNTADNVNASDAMASYISQIESKTTVLVGTKGNASKHLTLAGKAALSLLGAQDMSNFGRNYAFCLIGIKDGAPSQVKQVVSEKANGSVIVKQRVPSIEVPLCWDRSKDIFRILISIIHVYYNKIRSEKDCNKIDVSILISSLNILTTNVYQLTLEISPEQAYEFVDESGKQLLRDIVEDLFQKSSSIPSVIISMLLRLGICAVDLLCLTRQEKLSVLFKYLDFANNTDVHLEDYVLPNLMIQFTPSFISKCCEDSEESNETSKLFVRVLSIVECHTMKQIALFSNPMGGLSGTDRDMFNSTSNSSFGEIGLNILSIFCNVLLSHYTQLMVESSNASPFNTGLHKLIMLFDTVVNSSTNICRSVLQAIDKLMVADVPNLADCCDKMSWLLESSSIRTILPLILSSFAYLFDCHSSKILHAISPSLVATMTKCSAMFRDIRKKLLPKIIPASHCKGHKETITYESEHPYKPNARDTYVLNYPGASRMIITFDEKSRTEPACDYVRIWKDATKKETWHPHLQKLTGRRSSAKWPGVGDQPALEIEGSEAFVEFYSDSSDEDWGWRFDVVVEFQGDPCAKQHFLLDVENEMNFCWAVVSSKMIEGIPWIDDLEAQHHEWLTDTLFSNGFSSDSKCRSEFPDEIKFLLGFLDRPEGSAAEKFCRIMKKYVLEDQGNDDLRNRAVYLACAAIIYHSNLTAEAMQIVSEGKQSDTRPSDSLLKAWKYGQSLRSFLNFGNVAEKAEDDLDAAPSLVRGCSVYSEGKDSDIVRKSVNMIVSRAHCLLSLRSEGVMSTAPCRSEGDIDNCEDFSSICHFEEVDRLIKSAFLPSGCETFRKFRASNFCGELPSKLSSHNLKNLNVSERIIKFLKSDTDIGDLMKTSSIRSERACSRALGLKLLADLLLCDSSAWVQYATSILRETLAKTCSKVHFLNSIEGCSVERKISVLSSYEAYITNCIAAIMHCITQTGTYNDNKGDNTKRRQDIAVCCLKGMCLDYDCDDFVLLLDTKIVKCLSHAVLSEIRDVRDTAVAVIEFLLSRGFMADRQNNARSATALLFIRDLLSVVVGVLNLASRVDCNYSVSRHGRLEEYIQRQGGIIFFPNETELMTDSFGYRVPHIAFGNQYSIMMWIRRPRRYFDNVMKEIVAHAYDDRLNFSSWTQIKRKLCGMHVVRGPHWSQCQNTCVNSIDEDADYRSRIGVIHDFDIKMRLVTVQWHGDKSGVTRHSYLFGGIEGGEVKFEVTLADDCTSGHIYSVGMKDFAVGSNSSVEGSEKQLKSFGLHMNADGRVQSYMMSCGSGDNHCTSSSSSIPPETWTHVCVVHDHSKTQIYINGKLDSQSDITNENLPNCTDFDKSTEDKLCDGLPLFVGQTPFYARNVPGMPSFEGKVRHFSVFKSQAITLDSLRHCITLTQDCNEGAANEMLVLDSLGLLRCGYHDFRVFFSTLVNDDFTVKMILVPLLRLLKSGSAVIEAATLKVCASLLPTFPPNIINIASEAAELTDSTCSLLDHIFAQLGKSMNAFSADGERTLEMGPSAEAIYCVRWQYINLLSELTTSSSWSSLFDDKVQSILAKISIMKDCNLSQMQSELYDSVLAVLALCGGNFDVLSGGCSATYRHSNHSERDDSGGMMEDCTILAPTWPPTISQLKLKWNGKEKELDAISDFAMWKDKTDFCDAYYVVLQSQPSAPLKVPRDKLHAMHASHNRTLETYLKKNSTQIIDFFLWVLSAGTQKDNMQVSRADECRYSQLKVSGMVALYSILTSFSWLAAASTVLLESLVNTTLLSIPNRPIPPHPPHVKPIMLESKHDYDHNANDYFPIEIPQAKSLRIVFDPETRCERNYDYMRFYCDESHTDYYGDEKYTGGRGNWPGTGSKPPLIIPSNSVVIYWKTDSSGNDWGWRLTITVETYRIPQQSDVGFMAAPECFHHLRYLHMVQFDGQMQLSLCSHSKPLKEPVELLPHHASSPLDTYVLPLMKEARKGWKVPPLYHKQNELQINVAHCTDGKLTLFEEASETSRPVSVLDSSQDYSLLVLSEKNDWVEISCVTTSDGRNIAGWLRRRKNDVEYLVPRHECDLGHLRSVKPIALDDNMYNGPNNRFCRKRRKRESEHSSARKKDPMFDFVENIAQSRGFATMKSPVEVLQCSAVDICLSIHSISLMAAVSLAQNCIAEIFSVQSQYDERFVDCFDSPKKLIAYLKTLHFCNIESQFQRDYDNGSYETIENMLKQFDLRNDDKYETRNVLFHFSFNQLLCQLFKEMGSEALPRSMGVVKTLNIGGDCNGFYVSNGDSRDSVLLIESRTDDYGAEITVPGAQVLSVVFEGESIIPENEGSLALGSAVLTSDNLHSRTAIKGEKCYISWKPAISSSTDNSWALSANIYAQFSGPSLELRNAFESLYDAEESPSVDLACWLLMFLVRGYHSEIENCIYSPHSMSCLGKLLLEIEHQHSRHDLVKLISIIFQSGRSKCPPDSAFEFVTLIKTVTKICERQKEKEGAGSASKYLQDLIVCILTLCSHLIDLNYSANEIKWENDDIFLCKKQIESGLYSEVVFSLQPYDMRSSQRFHVRFGSDSDSPCTSCVGIMSFSGERLDLNTLSPAGSAFTVAWMQRTLFVCCPKTTFGDEMHIFSCPFGPNITSGDIISIDLNIAEGIIGFYRNTVFVGLAVGPPDNNAAVTLDLSRISGPFYAFGSAKNYHENLMLLPSSATSLVHAPLSLFDYMKKVPSWLISMQEAIQILKSCSERAIPHSVLIDEFLPACEKKAEVILSCKSLLNDLRRDIAIPLANSLLFKWDFDALEETSAKMVLSTPARNMQEDTAFTVVFQQDINEVKVNTTLPLFNPRIPASAFLKRFRHPDCAALRQQSLDTDKEQCCACGGFFSAEQRIVPKKHEVKNSRTGGIVCNEHPCLLQNSDGHGREEATCDVCGIDEDGSQYFCGPCDFDVCNECFVPACETNDISQPPAFGRIVTLDRSHLSCTHTAGGHLHNVLDYSSADTFWEESNSSRADSRITINLSENLLDELGEEYHFETYNANYGGAYDPVKIKVFVAGICVSTVDLNGSEKKWMTIVTSDRLTSHQSSSKLSSNKIEIHFHSDGCNFKVSGLRLVCTAEKRKKSFCSVLCEQHGEESCVVVNDGVNVDKLIPGDFVVRGPDWRWGQEDGGVGSIGVVLGEATWADEPCTGVWVRWKATGYEGLYRYKHGNGCACDVLLFKKKIMDECRVLIPGAEMRVELKTTSNYLRVDSEDSTAIEHDYSSIEERGSPYFNGLTSVMHLPCSSQLDFSQDFTVEVWLHVSADVRNEASSLPIVGKCIERDSENSLDLVTISIKLSAPERIKCPMGHALTTIPVGSKHPQYVCGYAMCNICGGDTNSSEETYFCEHCEYDMCHACGSRCARDRPLCRAGHFMEILSPGSDPISYKPYGVGAAQCDMCAGSDLISSGNINYHCALCQYDLCYACGQQELTSKRTSESSGGGRILPTCEVGHGMTIINKGCRVPSYTGSQCCDICGKSQLHQVGTENYHCTDCQYDLCFRCGIFSIFLKKYPHYNLPCSNGHVYSKKTELNTSSDCCNCTSVATGECYLCEQCDQVLCRKCAAARFSSLFPRLNRDRDFAHVSTGLNNVWYCGRLKNECRCGSCDGKCGPSNGCPCNACSDLSQHHIVMYPKNYHARIRRGKSFESEQVGLIDCGSKYHFTMIDGNWAKVDPAEYSRMSSGSDFVAHNPEEEGWCALYTQDGERLLHVEGHYFPTSDLHTDEKTVHTNRTGAVSFVALNSDMTVAIEVTGGTIVIGQWTHIGVVMTGDEASIFINGERAATSAGVTGRRLDDPGLPLLIGCTKDSSATFHGHMFDMRLWTTSRTGELISRDMKKPLSKSDIQNRNLVGALLQSRKSLAALEIFTIPGSIEERYPGGAIEYPEAIFDVEWDALVDLSDSENAALALKCSVRPQFSLDTILAKKLFLPELELFQLKYLSKRIKDDYDLVRYVNAAPAANKSLNINRLLSCGWKDLAPSGRDKRSKQLLVEYERLCTVSSLSFAQEGKFCATSRFQILQRLNSALLVVLPYFDLRRTDEVGSFSNLLCTYRGLVFGLTKEKFWLNALAKTEATSSKFTVKLSRSRAAKHSLTGIPDYDGKYMVFSQAFRQIHRLPPKLLRRSGQLYNTVFMGEHSNDAGGPYSESFAMMCLELQSPSLPLLIRTRNGVGNIGQNKEKWVLNPSANASIHLEMFCFLGKLMGIAIRSKEYLGLNISSIIWKLLVKDTPTKADLEAINLSYVQSLDRFRTYDEETIKCLEQTFTLTTWDNREVELIPGGSQVLVTYATRDRYCDLCEHYCLHEYDVQAAMVRNGLGAVVPLYLLSLYSWQELDNMVCGDPFIDVDLLKSMTSYQSCSLSDEHIQNFWTVMEEFSEEEKAAFLRFTWGRSRLPLTREGFSRKLRIEQFTPRGSSRATQDESLPVAHTCFFSLELPTYSTLSILREKLSYAIKNCVAIDVDNDSTGQSAAELGWEEF